MVDYTQQQYEAVTAAVQQAADATGISAGQLGYAVRGIDFTQFPNNDAINTGVMNVANNMASTGLASPKTSIIDQISAWLSKEAVNGLSIIAGLVLFFIGANGLMKE